MQIKSLPKDVHVDRTQTKPYKSSYKVCLEIDDAKMEAYIAKQEEKYREETRKEILDYAKQWVEEGHHVHRNGAVYGKELFNEYRPFMQINLEDKSGNRIGDPADLNDWEYTGGECNIISEIYSNR